MSIDVATLGLRIDSREVKAANDDLEVLSRRSADAERGTKSLERGFKSASTASRSFAGGVGIAEGALSGLSGIAAGVAAALAGIFAGLSVRPFISATSEAEGALAQLASAVRSTGGAAGMSVGELSEMASELEGLTKFGDEAIMSAQGILLTFTRIGRETFPATTQAVLDVAQAMNMDLKSAALQVGKAMNAPKEGLTALSRAGIQFSADQKTMIETMVDAGNVAGAQKVILAELTTQFGGSARAARDTLGGALAGLSNQFGNLFEVTGQASAALKSAIEGLTTAMKDPAFMAFVHTIGAVLFGALTIATQALTGVVNILPTVGEYALVAGGAMLTAFAGAALFAGLTAIPAAIGAITAAMGGLLAIMAANPFTAFVVAIGIAATAAYAFRDTIRDAIGIDVVELAKGAANGMIGLFVGAFQAIVAGVKEIPAAFAAAFTAAMNGAVTIVQNGVNGILGQINRVFALVGLSGAGSVDLSSFMKDPGAGGDIAGAAGAAFSGAQKDYIGALAKTISDFTAKAGEQFGPNVPGKVPPFAGGGNAEAGGKGSAEKQDEFEKELANIAKKTREIQRETETFGMNTRAKAEAEAQQKLLEAAYKAGIIESANMSATTEDLAGKIRTASAAYGEAKVALEAMQRQQEAQRELQTFIGQSMSGFYSDIVSGGKNAESALMNLTKKLADAAAQALLLGQGPLAAIFGTASSDKGGVGGLVGTLFSFFKNANGNVYANDNLVPFARGGAFTNSIVDSPTVFPFAKGTGLMGEAGPEAIMPLKRGPNGALGVQMHGGGRGSAPITIGGTTVTIQGNADPKVAAMITAGIRENNKTILAQVEAQRRRQA